MPQEMIGRRIPYDRTSPDPFTKVTQAGDYYGPDNGEFSGGISAVWFLLPIARDDEVPSQARCLHHICSPPHRLFEEADGTLTARESIGAGSGGPYYWHGYLTAGRWELNKSKP
jgi:hypothetical protein